MRQITILKVFFTKHELWHLTFLIFSNSVYFPVAGGRCWECAGDQPGCETFGEVPAFSFFSNIAGAFLIQTWTKMVSDQFVFPTKSISGRTYFTRAVYTASTHLTTRRAKRLEGQFMFKFSFCLLQTPGLRPNTSYISMHQGLRSNKQSFVSIHRFIACIMIHFSPQLIVFSNYFIAIMFFWSEGALSTPHLVFQLVRLQGLVGDLFLKLKVCADRSFSFFRKWKVMSLSRRLSVLSDAKTTAALPEQGETKIQLHCW